jgi:membrane fusion protein, multidrug efflux system
MTELNGLVLRLFTYELNLQNASRTERFGSNHLVIDMAEPAEKYSADSLAAEPIVEARPVTKLKVAPQAPVQQPPESEQAKPEKPSAIRRIMLGAVVVGALAGAGYYGYDWYTLGRFQVSTDDAYVKADMSQIGAKAAGYVTEIPAAENSVVKAGDVILKLDDGDFKLAVDAAEAKIETQKAVIASFDQQIAAQQTQVASAKAKLDSANASVAYATAANDRTSRLVKNAYASRAQQDTTRLDLQRSTASVNEATAGIAAAEAQIDVLKANKIQAERSLAELQNALTRAERDLSFTEIRAPFDGIVANRAVEVGQYIQAGTRVMALVPANQSFIEANFKETQLGDIHAGQKAKIEVDALGGATYEGTVASIAPASGAEFSLLPPENATGNFTKITQRVPVKIAVAPELAAQLRLGLSTTVTVDKRDLGQN